MALTALQRYKTARRLWNVLPERVRDEASKTLVYRRPVTFNDKIRYKMLNDRRPLLTTFADKVAVRDYVARKAGVELLTQLYLVTDDPEQVRADDLPREFVVKASHGCGGIAVVADHAPPQNRLPQPPARWSSSLVSPDNLDWTLLRALCREWLGLTYNPYREWAYTQVPPRILAEELLGNDSVPADYRFFVFHGRVRMIHLESGRFGCPHTGTFYSPQWERLPVAQGLPNGPEVDRPGSLTEMISVAERLGQETDFVRVDLYEVADRIVFGEMTNYPAAGRLPFEPASFECQLGSWWHVPDKYR